MAWPGVALVGTAMPSSRRTSYMRFFITKTDWPIIGLEPEGKSAEMVTRMEALTGDEDGAEVGAVASAGVGADSTAETGEGVAGLLEAMEVEEAADLGEKVE